MKIFYTLGLLVLSNIFMTLAWYGHLKFFDKGEGFKPLWIIILISWGLAFFEYCFQIPANRIGFSGHGGPFTLLQLKVIQEVITLIVFIAFSFIFFKQTTLTINHGIGLLLLVGAVYFIFKS